MNEKKALGKGLSALIGEDFFKQEEKLDGSGMEKDAKLNISINKITLNPYQPRKNFNENEISDLADSIKQHGVLQPILVKKSDENTYQLIAGERRYRACIKIGLETIPAIVKDISDDKLLEVALIENIQREDLDSIEEAKAIYKLMNDLGLTQEQVSKSIGKSRSYIANSLRLLTLPEEIQMLVIEKKISAGHARALIGKPNQKEIINKILNENLTVRAVESYVNKGKNNYFPSNKNNFFRDPADKDEALIDIEKGLSEALGMRVYIRETEQGGQLVITFLSLDQLDDLMQRLSGCKLGF